MLRVGKDKITQERLIHTHSFDERDLIGGLVLTKIEYSEWVATSVRTQEARAIQVSLLDPKGRGLEIKVSGEIDRVIQALNVLNGTAS